MTEFGGEIRAYAAKYFETKFSQGDFSRSIRDLRIDSLDFVEFVMALEEKFGIEIKGDELDQDISLEQFCAKVAQRR